MSTKPVSIEIIKMIAKALGELNDRAVFVGGATLPFYLPEPYLPQIRPTEDIDVVMEIVSRKHNSINEESLRTKGFTHDTSEGAPVCRWLYRNIKVDIMSSNLSAFGFTNKWYQEGIETAIEVIRSPVSVKIFNLPCFAASKIEAFKSRGKSDYLSSKDMEDIISVLEVSIDDMFEKVMPSTSKELQNYLKKEFQDLLKTSDFIDAIPGAVFNRNNTTDSTNLVKQRIKKFCETM